MSELTRFPLGDGEDIVIETDPARQGLARVARRPDGLLEATSDFTERLGTVQRAVGQALAQFRDSLQPDDIHISFGVKFTAEAGAVIARTAFEGHLTVELDWHREGTT
ncbi:CU044_2847 family protein [Streptomyces sp. FR-108]|uniref:CU044_2847 family protein n=1 Tax=Streptomyces sp. FR-108 TaxID=3416665 RepID=UPI003CF9D7D0